MQTYSISEAKQKLGDVADLALNGEPVLIVRKSKLLILQPYSPPEQVSARPPGYFADCYSKSEAKESNRVAKRGPKRVVK